MRGGLSAGDLPLGLFPTLGLTRRHWAEREQPAPHEDFKEPLAPRSNSGRTHEAEYINAGAEGGPQRVSQASI